VTWAAFLDLEKLVKRHGSMGTISLDAKRRERARPLTLPVAWGIIDEGGT